MAGQLGKMTIESNSAMQGEQTAKPGYQSSTALQSTNQLKVCSLILVIYKYHHSMSSTGRYTRKNLKSKILAYSDFALVSFAQQHVSMLMLH